jgi:hypothetical protein
MYWMRGSDHGDKNLSKYKAFCFRRPNSGIGKDYRVVKDQRLPVGIDLSQNDFLFTDDGIEKDHPDLIRNYDPLSSTDINDGDSDPNPR